MQLVAALVLGFLLHAVPSLTVALSEGKVWLHNHQAPPSEDELAELKTENPEAYAIVKSLLVKRSLGLLNPKHPTASFQVPAASEDSSSATEATDTTAVAAPAKHDWLSWKPQENAANDDAMVKSVLGEVTNLKAQPQNDVPSDATKNSDTSLEWKEPPAAQQAAQLEAQPVAQTVTEPVAPLATQQQNQLVSSKWDDETPPGDMQRSLRAAQLAPDVEGAEAASGGTDVAPKQEPRIDATPKQVHTNALLSWLGGSSESSKVSKAPVKPVTQQQQQQQQQQQEANPYLSVLS